MGSIAPITPAKAGFSLRENPIDKKRFSLLHANFENIISSGSAARLPECYPDGTPLGGRSRPALSEAQRLRLVEDSKCPTQKNDEKKAAFAAQMDKIRFKSEMSNYTVQLLEKAYAADPERLAAERESLVYGHIGSMSKRAIEPSEPKAEGSNGGAFAVWSFREWSGEYRLRTQVETSAELPPEQEGPRITHALTDSAAKKIADSCHYMHLRAGGYRTFLTLTFDEAGRQRVAIREADGWATRLDDERKAKGLEKGAKVGLDSPADGPYCPVFDFGWSREDGKPTAISAPDIEQGYDVTYTTIQKELGRFFDAANKMRQRGWRADKTYPWGKVTCYEREGVPVSGEPSQIIGIKGYLADKKIKLQRLPVRYCWVIENPVSERGQRNPHVHILMDWRVKFSAFASWADRLESLWGQGFAHIEKIKDSSVAGAYMAKAAGYLSKANGEDDQGPVRGNRYGISALSRAPEWVCIKRLPLHVAGHLIKDVSEYYQHTYAHLMAKRAKLNARKDRIVSQMKDVEKNQQGSMKRAKARIGAALSKVRDTLKAVPVIPSKHQIILKTDEAANLFLEWLFDDCTTYGRRRWEDCEWLPPKEYGMGYKPEELEKRGLWYTRFLESLHAGKAVRRWAGMPLAMYAEWIKQEPERDDCGAWSDYLDYEREAFLHE